MRKIILSFALALTVIASGMTCVKAGQSYDFDFNFNGVGHWQLTNVASKNNTSYVAMKCTYAEVQGSCYDAVVVSMPDQAQRCPAPYRFYEGTYQLMTNYVRENGYTQTRVDAWCVDDQGGQGAEFAGYWYADSDIY